MWFQLAKKARVYDGTAWQELASAQTDLTAYSTTAEISSTYATKADFPEGTWQTWAPTLSGGWANGNGIWDAKYVQVGKTVHFAAYFIIGSTTTKGSNLIFSLPVASKNSYNLPFHAFCSPNALLIAHRSSVTTGIVLAVNAAGTYAIRATVNSTVPVTWATGQTIGLNGTYEAA
jgi:hypothetical protein